MEELDALRAIAEPPPVPVTAIFSRDDGVIDWRASVPAPSEMVEVVEVSGPHMTVCSNPRSSALSPSGWRQPAVRGADPAALTPAAAAIRSGADSSKELHHARQSGPAGFLEWQDGA